MLRAAVSSLLGGGGGDRTAQPAATSNETAAGASTRDSFDLCSSSDDEAEPAATPAPLSIRVKAEGAKKAIKTEGKRSSPAADDDDECQIDDRPHKAARSSSAITPLSSPTGDSDDVMVTGAIDPSMAFAHARCALDPSAPQSGAPWH
jgi:hypothetical protein